MSNLNHWIFELSTYIEVLSIGINSKNLDYFWLTWEKFELKENTVKNVYCNLNPIRWHMVVISREDGKVEEYRGNFIIFGLLNLPLFLNEEIETT